MLRNRPEKRSSQHLLETPCNNMFSGIYSKSYNTTFYLYIFSWYNKLMITLLLCIGVYNTSLIYQLSSVNTLYLKVTPESINYKPTLG
jgi:hypothetical protein